MIILNYVSKKDLRAAIGQSLNYTETSMFGTEYKPNGDVTGCNRPSINRRLPSSPKAREFYATVTMRDGLIAKVS